MLGKQAEDAAYFSEMWRKFIFYTEGTPNFAPNWERAFTARSYRVTPGLTPSENILIIDNPRGAMDVVINDWPVLLDFVFERLSISIVLIHQGGRYWRCEWVEMIDGDMFWDIEEICGGVRSPYNCCNFDIL